MERRRWGGTNGWKARCTRSRRAGFWLLGLFALSQMAGASLLEWAMPRWRDPEYFRKVDRLRTLRATDAGRPSIIALGSSRLYVGLRPGLIQDSDEPQVFNGGLVGAGPILELLALERLLRAGESPTAVVVEFWPVYFLDRPGENEETRIDPNRLDRHDVQLVSGLVDDPRHFSVHWGWARMVPSLTHRFVARNLVIPTWDPTHSRLDHHWHPVDPWGWKPGRSTEGDPEVRRAGLRASAEYYGRAFRHPVVRPLAERAMEELFALCRRHSIAVAVMWLPESSEFRALYPPEVESMATDLLGAWQCRPGVSTINARRWISDEDLIDGFHLTPEGAAAFTERFAREALPNWRSWPVPTR